MIKGQTAAFGKQRTWGEICLAEAIEPMARPRDILSGAERMTPGVRCLVPDGTQSDREPLSLHYLRNFGIPGKVLEVLAFEHAGHAGLLDLQRRGIIMGLCDKDKLLNASGIISAPTCAGKTLLAELRMLVRYFAEKRRVDAGGDPQQGKAKTVFLVPMKAIGLEKLRYFRDTYSQLGIKLCYSDGDVHSDDSAIMRGRFDVVVLVNEKLKFFEQHNPEFFKNVGEVVVDELGIISDKSRGPHLEMVLTGLISSPYKPAILGLTTPLDGIETLAKLLGGFLLESEERPIDIRAGVWLNGHFESWSTNTLEVYPPERIDLGYPANKDRMLREIVLRYKMGIMFAVPSKPLATDYARRLCALMNKDGEVRQALLEQIRSESAEEKLSALEPTRNREMLAKHMRRGIAFHHADLSPEERIIVENGFRNGEISVVFCTSTLARGVNLPAQAIIFLDWGDGLAEVPEMYPYCDHVSDDLVNWVGRIGRLGKRMPCQPVAMYLAQTRGEADRVTNQMRRKRGTLRMTLADRHVDLGDAILSVGTKLHNAAVLRAKDKSQEPGKFPFTMEEMKQIFAATPTAADRDRLQVLLSRLAGGVVSLSRPPGGDAYLRLSAQVGRLLAGGQMKPVRLGWREVERMLFDLKKLTGLGGHERCPAWDEMRNLETTVRRSIESYVELAAVRSAGVNGHVFDRSVVSDLKRVLEKSEIIESLASTPSGRTASEDKRPKYLTWVPSLGKQGFELTHFGKICSAYGISTATVDQLHRWSTRMLTEDIAKRHNTLVVFQLLLNTADGRRIAPLKTHLRPHEIGAFLKGHAGRCPDKHITVTCLAMKDWIEGVPTLEIERTYGIYCGSLYEVSRQLSRLVRSLRDIARNALKQSESPACTEPNPLVKDGLIGIPEGLGVLADMARYGLPSSLLPIAHLHVEGLSRYWIMKLAGYLDEHAIDYSLPTVERLQLLSEDQLRSILPTRSLVKMLREGLAEQGKVPLAKDLVGRQEFLLSYYLLPQVVRAQVDRGRAHYGEHARNTAVRVPTADGRFAVFRRNDPETRQPIRIENEQDVIRWLTDVGAIDFYGEIGEAVDGPDAGTAGSDHGKVPAYVTDRFFVDLDPKNDYPMDKLKAVAERIYRLFTELSQVDQVKIFWTGGKGFYVVGFFREGISLEVRVAKQKLNSLLRERVCNDTDIFMSEDPANLDSYVILDLSPVMPRGLYRNEFSIHAATGGCCLLVPVGHLNDFEPVVEAKSEVVRDRLIAQLSREEKADYVARLNKAIGEETQSRTVYCFEK